jgi:hypothetical protein
MSEAVGLLHGMGRSWVSMAPLALRLKRAGYQTHLFGYNPRKETLDDVTTRLKYVASEKVDAPSYHFIGHSLGNIVVRNGFRTGYREGLRRIVMLCPPNGPAALAISWKDWRLYQWVTGDSGQKLADTRFYETLPVPSVEFGVIAGDKGHRVGFEEANDGVVRVENTKLVGMRDWVLLHHTHTFMMMAADTSALCRRFLETGFFRDGTQF